MLETGNNTQKDMKKIATLIISSAVIAVGLLCLGLAIRSGLKSFTDRDRTVEVRGLATREVAADKVTWPIVFKSVGNDLPTVYAQNAATGETVVKFLKDNGMSPEEISVGAPSVTDLSTDRYNNQPIPYNYSVQTVVTVSSSKVDQVRALINRQGELLEKGIAVQSDYSNRITYSFTHLNDIKPEMIAEATQAARDAAKKFADDSGSEVGKIRSARQGQFSIDDRDEYTPYIKEVRVVTTLTYALED